MVLPTQVRVELGAMTMLGYSKFSRSPEQKPHHQKWFIVVPMLTWFRQGHLAYVPGGVPRSGGRKINDKNSARLSSLVQSMTSKVTWLLAGRLSKGSIVHIAPNEPMTSIVQKSTSFDSCMTSPSLKYRF